MKAEIREGAAVVLNAYPNLDEDEVAKLLVGKKAVVAAVCKGGDRAWVKILNSEIQIPWPVEYLEKFSP